nr:DegT/DnrJ/EryC1/StrS aminotransferase [SAR324 cluster bacterium]
TVMIPTDPRHSEEQIAKMIRNIEVAAKFAFGQINRSEIKSKMTEFKEMDKIDARRYDTEVAAYGLGR